MKRTTISLPGELAAGVEREARRRRISISELTRGALARELGMTGERRRLPFAALGRSGRRHVARFGDTDASVLALAERVDTDVVITFDRHFGVVRPRHCPALRLLPE
jgi:hypothetical protein